MLGSWRTEIKQEAFGGGWHENLWKIIIELIIEDYPFLRLIRVNIQ